MYVVDVPLKRTHILRMLIILFHAMRTWSLRSSFLPPWTPWTYFSYSFGWLIYWNQGLLVGAQLTSPHNIQHLLQVNAFRSMMHNSMMVGAFSHSTAVGKLRKDLPDVPLDARVNLPRYSLDEAAAVCHYYHRYVVECI